MKRKQGRPLSREILDLRLTPSGSRAFVYANPVVILSPGVISIIEGFGGNPENDIDVDVFAHRALGLWKTRRFNDEGEKLDGILFQCGDYRFMAKTAWRNNEPVVSFAVAGEEYPEIL